MSRVPSASDAVHHREADLGPVGHRDRHREVELDDRGRVHPGEGRVQRRDLRPVRVGRGRRPRRGARRWPPGAGTGPARPAASARSTSARPSAIRAASQRDRSWSSSRTSSPSGADPRLPASVVEEHQREEAHDLRLVGEQRPHDPGQADRLARELAAHEDVARGRGVALVEDQVEDLEHAAEPLRQERQIGDPVRDAGIADLPLRADEALGERRLRDEEGPGDLGRRQAAERPQGQRHATVQRQRRVAAGEDQPESVVGDVHLVLSGIGRDRGELRLDLGIALERPGLLAQARASAEPVDGPVAGRRRDPRTGVVGHAPDRPRLERRHERLLDGLLGQVEVAEHPDERRDRPAGLFAEQAVDDLVSGGGVGQGADRVPRSVRGRRPRPGERHDRSPRARRSDGPRSQPWRAPGMRAA